MHVNIVYVLFLSYSYIAQKENSKRQKKQVKGEVMMMLLCCCLYEKKNIKNSFSCWHKFNSTTDRNIVYDTISVISSIERRTAVVYCCFMSLF